MKFVWLGTIGLAAWVLLGTIAKVATGDDHWLMATVAGLICFVPAMGTMAFLLKSESQGPVASLGAVLVAPLIRLVVVLVLGFAIGSSVPAIRDKAVWFCGWVLVFYLIALVAETALLLPKKRLASPAAPAPGPNP